METKELSTPYIHHLRNALHDSAVSLADIGVDAFKEYDNTNNPDFLHLNKRVGTIRKLLWFLAGELEGKTGMIFAYGGQHMLPYMNEDDSGKND